MIQFTILYTDVAKGNPIVYCLHISLKDQNIDPSNKHPDQTKKSRGQYLQFSVCLKIIFLQLPDYAKDLIKEKKSN